MNKHTPYFVAALVLFATLLVFLPALRNDFVTWDDNDYAYENYHLRSLNWSFFQWAFTDISFAGYWYPLVWTSHAIDHALWGLNPFGHHLSSILLHSFNAFLVTLLIIKLLPAVHSHLRPPVSRGEGSIGMPITLHDQSILIAAGMTGMLFGLHPLHVEPAVWVSDRKDLLSSLFFLASILSYTGFIRSLEESTSPKGPWSFFRNTNYLLSLFFFLCSISCKTMAVTLPVVLLLLDWYPFKRSRTRQSLYGSLIEKLPFLAGSLLISIVSLAGQKAFGAISYLESTGYIVRIAVAFKALVMYLWKMVVPAGLLPFYPYPEHVSLLTFEYILPVILAGLITTACVLLRKQRPFFLVLWGYYVITIAPALGLVPVGTHYMADRYAYLPSIGPLLFGGLAAAWIWMRAGSSQQARPLVKGVAVSAAVVMLIVLPLLTFRQIGIWRNSIVFWSYVIEQEGDRVPLAYNNRGMAFLKAGQPERAVADHVKAIALRPDYPEYYNNRSVVYRQTGQTKLAMDDLEKAIALDPGFLDAYVNRGMMHKEMGQIDRALEDLTFAITRRTGRDAAYYYRGLISQEQGQIGPAMEDFTAALALNPYHADAYNNRGLLFAQTGQLDQAIEDLDAAIRLNPAGVEPYNNRALVFEGLGRFSEAIRDYGQAIDRNPSDHLSYRNRGIAFGKMGRIDEAIADHTKVLSLKPDFAQAYLERGELYRRSGREALAIRDYRKACALGDHAGCTAARGRNRQ